MTHVSSDADVLFCLESVLTCISHIYLYTANITSTGNLIISFAYFRVLHILECFAELVHDLFCVFFFWYRETVSGIWGRIGNICVFDSFAFIYS